jgi:hypothetical protein
MKVRGWLIVGGNDVNGLPPDKYIGYHFGSPPDASKFLVGQWTHWGPGTGSPVTLVCIEVPL